MASGGNRLYAWLAVVVIVAFVITLQVNFTMFAPEPSPLGHIPTSGSGSSHLRRRSEDYHHDHGVDPVVVEIETAGVGPKEEEETAVMAVDDLVRTGKCPDSPTAARVASWQDWLR